MEVCRLCLDLQSDNNYLPLAGNYKDMVQVVAPELNLEISNAPVVCNECSSNLDELFVFKTKCFENEQKIRPKCENNKNKFRLKQVLDGTTDVEETALKPDKTKDRVCRTCMEPIESESFTILKPSEPDAYLDSMLTMCLNDIDLELTKDPVICESCMDNLQKLHHFKSTSLDVEDKLTNFCETHGTNSSEQINLNSVLEYEISKTDADSGFVNVKVENYEDESEDASMKSEMGSEMTVDSELKQEEIDIKSEAGTSSDKKSRKRKRADLLRNELKKKLQIHKCTKCDFKVTRNDHLKRHLLKEHGKGDENMWKKCTKCPYKTFNISHLKKHDKAIHEKLKDFECSVCDYKTTRKEVLSRHLLAYHGDGDNSKWKQCAYCSYKTLNTGNLGKHERGVHKNVKSHECTECPYKAARKELLVGHLFKKHGKGEKSILKHCTKCSYKSLYTHVLRNHENALHPEAKDQLVCSECSYTTSMKINLVRHMLRRHGIGNKDMWKNCVQCSFRTFNIKDLATHVKRIHEKFV